MKRYLTGILLVILFLSAVIPTAAQWASGSVSSRPKSQGATSQHWINEISQWTFDYATRLTVDIKDASLADAVIRIFGNPPGTLKSGENGAEFVFEQKRGSITGFRIDPLLQKPPYDNLKITINAQNARFVEILAKLLDSNRLMAYLADGGIMVISPPSSVSIESNQKPGQNTTGSVSCKADVITKRIPALPVKDAVAMIEPGWTFKDSFGSRYVQGASFYNFPTDMAVSMLLIAAGLKPPAPGTKVVSVELKERTMSLSDLYQWTPPAPVIQPNQSYGGGMGSMGGFGGGRMGFSGGGGADSSSVVEDPDPAHLAIGAYKRMSPKGESKWLFTVLAGQVLDITLVDKLMATSGASYTMADLTQRPFYTNVTQSVGNGNLVTTQQVNFKGPQVVSVQLYDVALDQALQSILPMVMLRFHKEGPADKPTYVIEGPPLLSDALVAKPVTPKAGKTGN